MERRDAAAQRIAERRAAATERVSEARVAATERVSDARDSAAEARAAAAERVADAKAAATERVADAKDAAAEFIARTKPRFRGRSHEWAFFLFLGLGVTLFLAADGSEARLAAGIYAASLTALFGVSALYHRGRWSPRTTGWLKRFDHANIFLIIAGTYTPFCVLLLDPGQARVLLWIVWVGALLGVGFRVLWVGAPRWLYVPVYVALGWVAVVYLPHFVAAGAAVFVLVVVGGALYTLGGLVYGLKRPDPSPRWFGFHEVFHALTVAAFAVHCVGIGLALYGVGAPA